MEDATNNLPNISKDTTMDNNNMDTTMGDSEMISNTIDGMGKAGSDARPPLYGIGFAGCGVGKSSLINGRTTNLEPKSPNITTPAMSPHLCGIHLTSCGIGKSQLINAMTTNIEPKCPNVTAPTTSPPSEKKTSLIANSINKTFKLIGITKKTRSPTHTCSINKPTTKSGAHLAPTVSNTSPFMRLPANLRNKILLEALEPAASTATPTTSTSNPFTDNSTTSSSDIDTITSLFSLNRQIRTEIQTLMNAKAKTASKCKNTNEDDEVKVKTGEDDGKAKAKKEMEEMTNMIKEKLDLHAEMGGDNAEFEDLVAEAMKE